jgi:very-short-patch-repair endonuclease
MMKDMRLRKQKIVKEYLDNNNFRYQLYDQVIDSKCGLERPDFLFDCNTHFVVLEVDEGQHRHYQGIPLLSSVFLISCP